MGKKNYLIIAITAVIFIIAIIIVLTSNNKDDWTKDIFEANSYQLTIVNCNDRYKQIENNTLTTLKEKWNQLSNNGPWTGDVNTCYTTLNISYDTNGIIKEKQIMIIDNNSLVLNINNNTVYYTNAKEIIDYLNSLFVY